MINFETDVLIVGGGPSGASAAISLLLYAGCKVTIIESSSLNQTKVGENVSSAIFDLLQYLKLTKEDFGRDCFVNNYANTSYWGTDFPLTRDSINTAEWASFQADRTQFDFTLLERAANLGGIILPRTKASKFQQLDDHTWQVTAEHEAKGKMEINARFLIDASGRSATVSRLIGAKLTKTDQLVGIGAFLAFESGKQHQDVLLETSELGWWYSATLKNNLMTAIFFTDADIVSKEGLHKNENWNTLLLQTKHMKQRLSGTHATTATPWVRPAHSQVCDPSAIRNFIAVGDAAVAYDPVSSMGIGFALTSGCNAAAVVRLELDNHVPERISAFGNDLQRNFQNYLQSRRKIYQQEQRWPTSDFWLRRV